MPARESRGIHVELRLILPVGQPNPLQRLLVVAIERVGDQLIAQEIHLHQARNLGVVPLFDSGMTAVVQSAEPPARMEIDRARRRGKSWDASERANYSQDCTAVAAWYSGHDSSKECS